MINQIFLKNYYLNIKNIDYFINYHKVNNLLIWLI